MENFSQHIENLLAQHDYVVVPDFGGFVVQQQSAQIFPNYITPPLATIAFNPLMHHADGLLVIEISRNEQISYRLAVAEVEKEVAKIKSELKLNGNFQFGNLGVFSQNEAGAYTFSPISKANFLPQNFQLTDLQVSEKLNAQAGNQKKITITLHPTKLYRYVAAATIIFGLFFIAPEISDKRHSETANLASIPLESIQKTNLPTSLITQTAQVAIPDSIRKITPELPLNFHVIVASLATKESAENFCKEITSGEYSDVHVLPPVRTYRVAIQSFNDKEKAIEFMEKLRLSDSRFDTAWVLCEKSNLETQN